jgi:hypothetical protein
MTALRRKVVSVLAIGVLVLVTHVDAKAQARLAGSVTDEWGNGLAGARVILQSERGGGAPREELTEEDGSYLLIGVSTGPHTVEFHADGYQAIGSALDIRVTDRRPVDVELQALQFGSLFRDETEFEAEEGTPMIVFEGDGKFEFKDANGEGEGTYGIDALNVVLIVRDYDGPDDTYSINEPVLVTSPDDQFTSLTWSETTLMKK